MASHISEDARAENPGDVSLNGGENPGGRRCSIAADDGDCAFQALADSFGQPYARSWHGRGRHRCDIQTTIIRAESVA